MPTEIQYKHFAEDIGSLEHEVKISPISLNIAIQWMQQNLEPEDIFSEKQLSNWAEANGYIKE